jgi:hypothetical protein
MEMGIEEYARRQKRLHPQVIAILGSFFNFPLEKVKVRILRWNAIPSGRRGGRTPAFVLGPLIFFAKGVLNAPGYHLGNTFDLTTPEGISTLAHEIYHVGQWYRGRIRHLFRCIIGVFRSLFKDGILWSHSLIPLELKAMEFADGVLAYFSEHEESLRLFESLR